MRSGDREPASDRGRQGLGVWSDDERGRPVFDVDVRVAAAAVAVPRRRPRGRTGDGADPWHLVGSPGLLALAHLSGRISLYATAGGMVRLADRTAPLLIDGTEVAPVGMRLGVDSATWTFEHGPTRVERVLSCDPTSARLHLRWTVIAGRPVTVEERWELGALPLVPAPLMSRPVPPPSTHRGAARAMWRAMFVFSGAARSLTDAVRAVLGRRHPLRPELDPEPGRARWASRSRRRHPSGPRLALAVPPGVEAAVMPVGAARGAPGTHVDLVATERGPEFRLRRVPAGRHEAAATLTLHDPLPAGRPTATPAPVPMPPPMSASTPGSAAAPGLTDDPRIAREAAWHGARLPALRVPHPAPVPTLISASTPESAPSRGLADDPRIAREAEWHVAQLRALRVPDPWTGRAFVMQGSAYAFVHGVHGAVRDEAFVVAALARRDPATARDTLVAEAAMARADGTFHYAHAGYGAALSGGVHSAPTDLPLFFLWAVAEYLGATGDTAVLDERVRPRGREGTRRRWPSVGEVALLAARAVDRCVGRGPHGLLRVGSGDWADPIALMVRHRRAFRRSGESAFNTGMALAVLPMVAPVLESLDAATARRCADLAGELDGALDGAWTGEWYRRGWDGRGAPIGEAHCFLDAQLWPVIAGHGSADRRSELVATIAARCDDPSPIGPAILDRPHRVRFGMLADGWDCNGGVWAALGGLTAWAYALHDPLRAEALLRRLSFAGQQAAHPEIWFGQWSGPDARNSWMGDRPGETFVHPATPMTEFPVMNSNAHAGPLLGLEKLRSLTAPP